MLISTKLIIWLQQCSSNVDNQIITAGFDTFENMSSCNWSWYKYWKYEYLKNNWMYNIMNTTLLSHTTLNQFDTKWIIFWEKGVFLCLRGVVFIYTWSLGTDTRFEPKKIGLSMKNYLKLREYLKAHITSYIAWKYLVNEYTWLWERRHWRLQWNIYNFETNIYLWQRKIDELSNLLQPPHPRGQLFALAQWGTSADWLLHSLLHRSMHDRLGIC